jgi:hypothetical protein
MSKVEQEFEDNLDEIQVPVAQLIAAQESLQDRCKAAGILFEAYKESDDNWNVRIEMKCGRSNRSITLRKAQHINDLLNVPFEQYVFLSDLDAICSYSNGTIEAGIRFAGNGFSPLSFISYRLFGNVRSEDPDFETSKLVLSPHQIGLPSIEISKASETFLTLSNPLLRNRLTLKLWNCQVATNEDAVSLLQKISGSVLFQIDLANGIPFTLERERKRRGATRRLKRSESTPQLEYPKMQYESAPLSLYSYGRSAAGMPLLQFLAFYQVLEFFFPIYSQSEAQRKLKAILKDPTFRGDRDTDIAKVLNSVHVNRGGAYGDERSQLFATLQECTDSDSIRRFLEEDQDRFNFFKSQPKSLPYHKLPLASSSADLRNEVASRVYDIRCKIVHTKTDPRDSSFELLLPFTTEAEQLTYDIELVQYLAQQVLITSSTPLNINS